MPLQPLETAVGTLKLAAQLGAARVRPPSRICGEKSVRERGEWRGAPEADLAVEAGAGEEGAVAAAAEF